MFKFKSRQELFEIGNVRIGGQPGELPTVLIGNIFYRGMPEVTNHERGEFDRKSVLRWISTAEELSEKTGTPHLVDIMAMYPEAMKEYILFISEHSDSVLVVDGANSETRVAALKTTKELGLQEKVIFNAISPQSSQDELAAISESKVKAAILLAYNEMDFSPEGRISTLKGSNKDTGLLKTAEKAGIEKPLVDTVVFDVPSIAYAAKAIKIVKEETGVPAGCSPANATYEWRRSREELLRKGFAASNASAHAIAQLNGANFLIYGPIKQAKNLIPASAMNDSIIAYYAMRQLKTKPLVPNHPLYKIF